LWAELVSNRGSEERSSYLLGDLYLLLNSSLLPLFCLIRVTLTKLSPGFEAGGPNTPSNIDPWLIIGDESSIIVGTDRTSCFERNPVALRMEVLCASKKTNACPSGGVGVYNPGYWGMV
jgi:hypothetical protein